MDFSSCIKEVLIEITAIAYGYICRLHVLMHLSFLCRGPNAVLRKALPWFKLLPRKQTQRQGVHHESFTGKVILGHPSGGIQKEVRKGKKYYRAR